MNIIIVHIVWISSLLSTEENRANEGMFANNFFRDTTISLKRGTGILPSCVPATLYVYEWKFRPFLKDV